MVTPLRAHHAFTPEFDGSQTISLKGTVSKMEWVNPHAWIYIDVKGPDGQIVNWALELGAPNALLRRGWTKDSIRAGSEVVVTGYRARSGQAIANGRTVNLPDGRELFAGSTGTGAPVDGADPTEKR
jgi:hypothetical protein